MGKSNEETQEAYIKKSKLKDATIAMVNKNLTGTVGSLSELAQIRNNELSKAGVMENEGQVGRKGHSFGLRLR